MSRSYELDLLSRLVAIDTNANTKTGYVECSDLIKRGGRAWTENANL